MGPSDPFLVDEEMEYPNSAGRGDGTFLGKLELHYQLTVLGVAALIFLSGIVSPPSLVDDVDSAQAAIARTMLRSGDWVTARLDGVVYSTSLPCRTG